MKYKYLVFIPMLLTSCMRSSSYNITTILPLGAPSICFFDQGKNNDFVTATPSSIVPLFQNPDPIYDALIIDSRTGLLQSKKHNSPYKMAKLLTSGNLYLVGLNENKIAPSSNSIIYGFQENEIPGLIFKHIIHNCFHLDESRINWVDNASLIAPIAKEGLYQGKKVDYVLIAEPTLYSIKSSSKSAISTYEESLRLLWHNLTNQDEIPQAALFINKNAYARKKQQFDNYLSDLNARIDIAINDINKVKEKMDQYGDKDMQNIRFGFNADIIINVQKNNGLALYSKEYKVDKMNAFLDQLHLENYTSEDFII